MIAFQTADGIFSLPDCVVDAAHQRADLAAARVADFLNSTGPEDQTDASPRPSFPRGYLLELAAVLQVAAFEESGLRTHVEHGLPSFAEAAIDLMRRAEEDPGSFHALESATRHRRMLGFWMEQVAWQGLVDLGAEIAISHPNEEALVDAITEFVWANRHELSSGLSAEGERE